MGTEHILLSRHPELKELVGIIRYEVQQAQRPAHEIILSDEDAMRVLKISKRTLESLKQNRLIPRHQPVPRSKSYYLLSDLLAWLKSSRIDSIDNENKF